MESGSGRPAPRCYRAGDRLTYEDSVRALEAVAILRAKEQALRAGWTNSEVSSATWSVVDISFNSSAAPVISPYEDALARALGPCRRCALPVISARGKLRHVDPLGNPIWRTCRAAAAEWGDRDRPAQDLHLLAHWTASLGD